MGQPTSQPTTNPPQTGELNAGFLNQRRIFKEWKPDDWKAFWQGWSNGRPFETCL